MLDETHETDLYPSK